MVQLAPQRVWPRGWRVSDSLECLFCVACRWFNSRVKVWRYRARSRQKWRQNRPPHYEAAAVAGTLPWRGHPKDFWRILKNVFVWNERKIFSSEDENNNTGYRWDKDSASFSRTNGKTSQGPVALATKNLFVPLFSKRTNVTSSLHLSSTIGAPLSLTKVSFWHSVVVFFTIEK